MFVAMYFIMSFQTRYEEKVLQVAPLLRGVGVCYAGAVLLINASPLIAAEGYFFCLETKEAKIQVSKKASLPHKPHAANRSEPRAGNLLPQCAQATASAKVPYAHTTHKATIVLPAFGRSCFADRNKGLCFL
ncbi:hypothetical protein QN344_03350 [Mucilaginibacter sp. 5B2]|nr:hypothetical protein [Mucilaginibacter sp. 5B2]